MKYNCLYSFSLQCKDIPYLFDNMGKHEDGLNIAYSHPPAPPVPPRNYQIPNVITQHVLIIIIILNIAMHVENKGTCTVHIYNVLHLNVFIKCTRTCISII